MLSLQRELELSQIRARSWEQKSFKNPSKNEAKKEWYRGIDFSSFFLNFSSQVGLLGASWEPLGGILGPLGGILGHLGSILEASWAILPHPGASWRRLGTILALKNPQEKPGLAMEQEARFDSYAIALFEYLLYFSALANCKDIGGLNDSGALDRRGL